MTLPSKGDLGGGGLLPDCFVEDHNHRAQQVKNAKAPFFSLLGASASEPGALAGRGTTVPFHKGRDIAPTLLRKIARDIGLTVDQLLEHR